MIDDIRTNKKDFRGLSFYLYLLCISHIKERVLNKIFSGQLISDEQTDGQTDH